MKLSSLALLPRPLTKSRRRKSAKLARWSIDLCSQRHVQGWVYTPNDPDRLIKVRVLAGGQVAGEVLAAAFRQDLKSAGHGTGKYGFELSLEILDNMPDALLIHFIDAQSNAPLDETLVVFGNETPAQINICQLDQNGIRGTIHAPEGQCQQGDVVCVFADNAFVASAPCHASADESKFVFRMHLPATLYDGNPHVFDVEIAGRSSRCDLVTDILPAVPTPWSVIRDSSIAHGYAGLSRLAAWRYDALRSHVRSAVSASDPNEYLANITQAHDVVVEGYTARRHFPVLSLPPSDNPVVSIIIPVYNQFALTYHCLASLILSAGQQSFEVIVVDDCSTDQTLEINGIVSNLKVIRNDENQGFLLNCNKAAEMASGEYVAFLNNDTEVLAGWLDELVDVFDRFSGVGAVGAKLIYPDGRLQDAGGLVWDNGVPWNVGHGQNAEAPEYNYVRDVDYLTGAALMVHKTAWHAVEGFSAEYIPAYYEDTDLAFKLRDAGYRTLYSPHARVVHFEGMSNGTSLERGVKRYQALNAAHFTNTWKTAFSGNGQEGVEPGLAKDRNRTLRVLMVDHAVPAIGQDAGSYAAVQEMRLMIALGCKITFLPCSLEHRGIHVEYLQKMGVECIHAPFFVSVNEFLRRRGQEFDAVYVTRYDIAERLLPNVRELTHAKVLFNNADLHFLRELRGVFASGETDTSGAEATKQRELAVMRDVDAVLSYNDTEQAIIASHLMRDDHVFTCPWVLSEEGTRQGFAERTDIAFMGGFGHPPNIEAVHYFVEKILPLLHQKQPEIRLHIWGSRIPESLSNLDGERIIVEGYAETLADVFDHCRVFIAPLQSGAGIKGKVLDSVAYGVPTVLSPIAAEATGLVHNVSTLIASTPEQWAHEIGRLYTDPVLWEQLTAEASTLVQTTYSFAQGLTKMRAVFEYLELLQPDILSEQRA